MRMISGSGYIALHIGRTNGENIVTGCITSLETGIYMLIYLILIIIDRKTHLV